MSGSLFSELKRRNVFRSSAAYIALGWVVTQVTATIVPILHLPEPVTPIVLWIGVIGFALIVMFAPLHDDPRWAALMKQWGLPE